MTQSNQQYVVLLGTKGGPAIRPGSTMPTSSYLSMGGENIVVDCGLGVSRGLTDAGIRLETLNRIIITHLHSDHYLELGPLLHTAWTAGLKSQVEIWGPSGLDHYWAAFLESMQADIELRIEDEGRPDLSKLVTVKTITEGEFLVTGNLRVSAIRNVHPPLDETYALSFRTDDRHVVFSGDTAHFPELAEFSREADLLVHEAMLEPALKALVDRVGNGDDRLMKHLLRSHTAAGNAAELAQKAGVKALAFHHLIPSDDPDFSEKDWISAVETRYSGKFHLGKDGLVIPF